MAEKIKRLIDMECECTNSDFCCDRCESLEKKLRHAAKCDKYQDVCGVYNFWKDIDFLQLGNVALMIVHEWDFNKNGPEIQSKIMNIVRARINRGHDPTPPISTKVDESSTLVVEDESSTLVEIEQTLILESEKKPEKTPIKEDLPQWRDSIWRLGQNRYVRIAGMCIAVPLTVVLSLKVLGGLKNSDN